MTEQGASYDGEPFWTYTARDRDWHVLDVAGDGELVVVLDCARQTFWRFVFERPDEDAAKGQYSPCPCGDDRCVHRDVLHAYWAGQAEEVMQ